MSTSGEYLSPIDSIHSSSILKMDNPYYPKLHNGVPYPEAALSPLSFRPHIGVKEEAHDFLVSNDFILNGYRINYSTWSATLCSLFQLHNETINVWTHFLGFIVCLVAFLIMTYGNVIEDPEAIREEARGLLYLF